MKGYSEILREPRDDANREAISAAAVNLGLIMEVCNHVDV